MKVLAAATVFVLSTREGMVINELRIVTSIPASGSIVLAKTYSKGEWAWCWAPHPLLQYSSNGRMGGLTHCSYQDLPPLAATRTLGRFVPLS